MKHSTRLATAGSLMLAIATIVAGCSAPPPASSTGGAAGASAKPAARFLPCVMSDSGGFNDHSFNEQALDAVKGAAQKFGVSYKTAEAKTPTDYTPNIDSLINQKCTAIVAPSFNLVATVKAAAQAHPKIDFIQVDDNSTKLPNVKNIVFETNEAAFLAGYAAAAYSKTGVIGLYGGQQIPPVTIFMDGYVDGAAYYNTHNGKNVKVLGWDEQTQNGTFVGNFTNQTMAATITANMLDQKADVIASLASGLYQGTGSAIRSSGANAVLIGTDSDLFLTDTAGYKNLVFTSILKETGAAVSAVLDQTASSGKFDNAQYIGTLKNHGVGLAPFHDYASKIPSTLPAQLKTITAGIVDGSIKVPSPSSLIKQ